MKKAIPVLILSLSLALAGCSQVTEDETEATATTSEATTTTEDDWDGIEYVTWTETVLDPDSPSLCVQDGVCIGVDYFYDPGQIPEPSRPQTTTFIVVLASCAEVYNGDLLGRTICFDPDWVDQQLSDEPIRLDNEDFRLYQKTGGEYVDITPDNLEMVSEFSEDNKVYMADIVSNTLGDLEEGEYKITIGGYSMDFKMIVRENYAW